MSKGGDWLFILKWNNIGYTSQFWRSMKLKWITNHSLADTFRRRVCDGQLYCFLFLYFFNEISVGHLLEFQNAYSTCERWLLNCTIIHIAVYYLTLLTIEEKFCSEAWIEKDICRLAKLCETNESLFK